MSSEAVQTIPRVPESINFSKEEERILKYWEEIDAFQTCLKQSKGKPRYSFFDGPPFATGLPHYGHILAGTIKDIVTRYAHQQGFHVERRFGWDTHGLPVEFEIDKTLGIKGPDDVMRLGIDKYNAECRKIVMRYAKDWEMIITRLGRWIDFKNDYKTLYPSFMESVWWAFQQLYLKGLVYQGNKVMPYSTACNTPLSNFESGQNYKDVVDPAVTVSLPIIGHPADAALLVWTTTPWTLPSNLTACVNGNLIYALFEQTSTNKKYIMLEERIETIFQAGDYTIYERFPGEKLKGLRYKPIFDFFNCYEDKGFRVLVDDYVTAESGTGVVHQAPYFGEDDYRVCLVNGIITKDQDPICPVDASGRFTKPVTDFEGVYVKDADKAIIAALKTTGRLIHQSQIKHSYPYCWRSDTPLIYRAVPSWFIRVEQMTERLQAASGATYWVPEFVKDKRFGNWLRDARDWAVSRNRYFGTPMPIWMSPNGDEMVCVGSIAELEALSGQKITDIHRESIDHIEIPSKTLGNPPLKRISEVFDCWFESGSMPYAQKHYPFENVKEFEESFPADFVAEGIDQTRGWFYTLLVLSTALFDKAPYKNLIVNGLVLANDGTKMSKRLKNYPDPLNIVEKFGADALRLYLINSPVVRAENLRFKEEGVKDILKDVFLPWYNAFRFLMQNIEGFVQDNKEIFYYEEKPIQTDNVMDQWILSFTQSLLTYVRKEMALYRLYNVIPRLTKFIEYLTNWYVRMNRKRLKGDGGVEDCRSALLTLFEVLWNLVKMMAPFSPFITEYMYQFLRKLMKESGDSVHYLMLPTPNDSLIKQNIERAVSRMQSVIELGRVLRERKTIPIKYPLSELIIVHQNPEYLEDIVSLQDYIYSELNIRNIKTTTNKSTYGISLRAEPDYKKMGIRFRKALGNIVAAIKKLTDKEIEQMVKDGYKNICGERIEIDDVKLIFQANVKTGGQYEVNSDNDVLILLNLETDVSMQDEGTSREIINRIQKLRKTAHLVPTDQISVFYKTSGDLLRVATDYTADIETAIKTTFKALDQKTDLDHTIIETISDIKGQSLKLVLTQVINVVLPSTKWINIQVVGLKPRYGITSTQAIALIKIANRSVSLAEIQKNVLTLFGLDRFLLVDKNAKEITENTLPSLAGTTVYVVPKYRNVTLPEEQNNLPFCDIDNFDKNGICGTLILENPKGVINLTQNQHKEIINEWLAKK